MKTLDEVIDYCEGKQTCGEWIGIADALYYLKAFREAKDALFADQKRTIEAYCQWKDAKEKLEAQTSRTMWVDNHFQFEISDNPPLTWDELKQMKGEPVWIQEGDHGYWIIIDNFSITSYGYHWLNSVERCLEKEYMGISWQAYRRKE